MPRPNQRASLLTYLDDFRARDKEIACVHRHGYRTERWSYGRLAATACQVARELESRGIGAGHHILLWGENGAEWSAVFWGCLLRKAVVVPLDPASAPDFVGRVANQVRPELLVHSRGLTVPDGDPSNLILEDLSGIVSRHEASPFPFPEVDRTDTAEIIFTSGTTAEPRGVVITHGNVLANIEPVEKEMAKYIQYERPFHPIRFLSLLPLSHVFGQFFGLFVPPLMGGTVLHLSTLNPGEILRTLKRERVSVLGAVPRIMESLKNKLERDAESEGKLEEFRRDVETAQGLGPLRRWWRFRRIHNRFGWKFWAIVCGGATLPPETERFWRRLGFAVIQGYGLTETTSMISLNHPFKMSHGSIGQVLPGREMKLSDDGEILVRGSGVTGGYWSEGKLQPVEGEEGWFHTGDVGELDADGNLFFKGRKKNVIVTAEGMNIYPEDLEAALRGQESVRDCVVIEVTIGGSPEPCALVLTGASESEVRAAVEACNRDLADYQKIRRHLIWPSADFPRTISQKPKLDVLQAWAQAELQSPGAAVARGGSLEELVARIRGGAARQMSPGDRLDEDLQMTSLDRVELLSALEDRYQVEIDESRFTSAQTLGEIEKLLQGSGGARTTFRYPRWALRAPVRWLRLAAYYGLSWPATVVLGLPRLRGQENLRGVKGPVLVISNHQTMADVGYVLWALPPRLRHRLAVAMEGERLEAMRMGSAEPGILNRALSRINYYLVTALFNVFPLPQRSGFRESFTFAGEAVDRGYSVLVFPEGRRTPDGMMHPFRPGIGILTERLGIPVVPMHIEGLYELKKAGRRRARPFTVKVGIGEPVRFAPGTDADEVTRELQSRVAALA